MIKVEDILKAPTEYFGAVKNPIKPKTIEKRMLALEMIIQRGIKEPISKAAQITKNYPAGRLSYASVVS